jgi:hypothetical protein
VEGCSLIDLCYIGGPDYFKISGSDSGLDRDMLFLVSNILIFYFGV